MNRIFLVSLVASLYLVSCTREKAHSPDAVRIILDTDMGSDCDDAGALALLNKYADAGRAELIGCVYSSGKVPYGAGIVEAINIYYGRGDIPVGADHNTEVGDSLDKMGAEKLARDTVAFKNKIIHNRDAPEQTALNRKLLSAQPDGSVTYVTIGHTKGLYDLLRSGPDSISPLNGQDLVRLKVKQWIALGALGAKNKNQRFAKDWNFFFNGTAAYTAYLVKNFPAKIAYVDAGADVMTGEGLNNTPPGNMVRTAYRDWLWNVERKTLRDQRPSWDLAAVYYAVEGKGKFLKGEYGTLQFDAANGCRWQSSQQATREVYVSQREGIQAEFAHSLNELIGRPPGKE